MRVVINPGSGPVEGATEYNAQANMHAFASDLTERGIKVVAVVRQPEQDRRDGRFSFRLLLDEPDRSVEIDMPGLPLDQVRWMKLPEQNIWHFPRLYIDGSSWVWFYALNACAPNEEGQS